MNDLDKVIEKYAGTKGSLIPILQQAQEKEGYLSKDTIRYISGKLNIPVSEIYGVATFYAQFRFTPVGKYIIRMCHGTACHVGGIKILDSMIENKLKIKANETTEDGLFSIISVACLGCCSLAPVVMINDKTYGKLTNDKFSKIIDSYIDAEMEGKAI